MHGQIYRARLSVVARAGVFEGSADPGHVDEPRARVGEAITRVNVHRPTKQRPKRNSPSVSFFLRD